MPPIRPALLHLYLSPHFDDIAFSMGAFVAQRQGGTIINIFSRSAHVAGVRRDDPVTPEQIERTSALRDAEEASFAAAFGMRRIALGAEEPSLRGRHSRDVSGVADDIEQIRVPLFAALDALTAAASATLVFCPAGIGGHANHLATRSVALDWFAVPRPGARLWFYEDLPYAARWQTRWRGLRDLRRAAGGRPLRRHAWRADVSKVEQLRFYPSQHARPPTDLRGFSPATPWPVGAHEAAWELI